jgi:hypothetical protein
MMHDKFEFREPLNIEPDGTYITAGQMQFYLNRPQGVKNFKAASKNFVEYYNICRVYNLISDIMEDEPESAIFYWNPIEEKISMAFPSEGAVAMNLSTIEPHRSDGEEVSEDDDDPWGLFINKT